MYDKPSPKLLDSQGGVGHREGTEWWKTHEHIQEKYCRLTTRGPEGTKTTKGKAGHAARDGGGFSGERRVEGCHVVWAKVSRGQNKTG